MSATVTLSQPLAARTALGSVFPWERPYTTESIVTLTHNGANLFHIEMGPAATTRLVTARLTQPTATSTRDLDPASLIHRSAVRLALRADDNQVIDAAQVIDALDQAGPRPGDALIFATGWGDRPPTARKSQAQVTQAPRFTTSAVDAIIDATRSLPTDLALFDVHHLQLPASADAVAWVSEAPWRRPPQPSSAAQAYLLAQPTGWLAREWADLVRLLDVANVVLGLVDTGLLPHRCELYIAPFQVDNAGEVPCTVVARTTTIPD
jgi:kynurenine formamidase